MVVADIFMSVSYTTMIINVLSYIHNRGLLHMQMLMLEEVIRLIVSVRYPRERREMERLAPFILSPRLVKACMYFWPNLIAMK